MSEGWATRIDLGNHYKTNVLVVCSSKAFQGLALKVCGQVASGRTRGAHEHEALLSSSPSYKAMLLQSLGRVKHGSAHPPLTSHGPWSILLVPPFITPVAYSTPWALGFRDLKFGVQGFGSLGFRKVRACAFCKRPVILCMTISKHASSWDELRKSLDAVSSRTSST